MYAHLNVNYLKIDKLPAYKNGWQSIVDALQKGKFFSTTGEVLIPSFTVNQKGAGDTVSLSNNGQQIFLLISNGHFRSTLRKSFQVMEQRFTVIK